MRTIFNIALLDLRLTFTDRSAVLWMFIMPVAFAGFFGLVIGGGNRSPQDAKASLALVNEDGGEYSRVFMEDLKSEAIDLKQIEAGEKGAREDKVRTLIIPAGFTEKIRAGEQVVVRLEKDPGTSSEAALVAEARIVSAITKLIGRLVAESAGREDDAIGRGEGPVRMEAVFAGRAVVIPGGFAQSIPGNVVMFVMLVALTYGAASLTMERVGGQLRRLATTPVRRWEIIVGKILGRFVVAGLQIFVLVSVGFFAGKLFDLYIGNDVVSLFIVLLVYALAVAPLGLVFGAFFKDPDLAANIGVVATIAMAALGGCWWPIEIVSEPLKVVARLLPTGWAMEALHKVISFGYGLDEIMIPLGVLAGFSVVFTVIAARSLRVT